MPLVEHLRELRQRVTVSLVAFVVAFAVAYVLREQLIAVFTAPYCRSDAVELPSTSCALASFTPTDQLQALLRVCTTAAVVLSSPVWLYQLGRFVTPALHPSEKRTAAAFACAAAVLFVAGVLFAYAILSRALGVLLDIFGEEVVPLQGIIPYLRFVTLVLLSFGVAFLFPVFVMFAHLLGFLPVSRMRSWRRGVVFGLAVFTAVVTPTTDPITFLAMLVPLVLLYEGCVLVAVLRERRARRARAARPDADLDDDEATPSDLLRTSAQEDGADGTDAWGSRAEHAEVRGSRLGERHDAEDDGRGPRA